MTTRVLHEEQLQKMKTHPGFIAALDQSGGSTPHALALYGIKDHCWADDEMFDLVHQMRTRIITSPAFTGERIIGAILFEDTMEREIEDRRLPLERKTRRFVPEGGQGPSEREGRRPDDEANARTGPASGKGQVKAHFRDQDALSHQASQRRQHQEHRGSAIRNRSANHRRRPGTNCRT
jgi:hypothetical protein